MYATPMLRAVPMNVQTSSCCTITLYSESLGQTFVIRNPGCGTVVNQFPTCEGPISSPVLANSGADTVALPRQVQPVVEATLKTASGAMDTVRQALPVDLCVVSFTSSGTAGAMSATVSGV